MKYPSVLTEAAEKGLVIMDNGADIARVGKRPWVAAPWHTVSVLLILGFFSYWAARPQHELLSPQQGGSSSSGSMVWRYVFLVGSELALAYYAWVGVHWNGGTLRDIVGGRWNSWRKVGIDVGIAIPFWVVWEATAWLVHLALTRVQAATTPYQPPTGFLEIFFWILLSVAAGVCEEIVFRGYLQRQFQAATGSVAAAVALQAIIFGLGHAYQGWKQVIVIAVLGGLYGALVARRGDLRASMIAHAWSDVFEGYLRFL